jgi:nucleoside-diphosphate-sugar epimerase
VKNLATSISAEALRVAKNQLLATDRILIIGATGWFGRTATALAHLLGTQCLLIASTTREFSIGNSSFFANVWDEKQIRDFHPTIVIDAAYVTRDYVSNFDVETYAQMNRELTNRLLSITDIESIRKVITFSSGAAKVHQATYHKNSLIDDPYGYLKLESEKRIQSELGININDYAIVRAWSVSGALVTKVNGFAFSDLVSQARQGAIAVTATSRVYRRYCLVEESIAIALSHNTQSDGILDTGGELVEIRDLAKMIKETLPMNIELAESPVTTKIEDKYFSDSVNWDAACNKSGLISTSISEQIVHLFNWLKVQEHAI